MVVIILMSIATAVSVVTLVLGCMVCRRKLSEHEIQRKAFEKFRKRHMLHRGRMLSSRVDYVRSVSERTGSTYLSGFTDHTYEEMSTPPVPHPPIMQVLEPSPLQSSDYSFFDDSFQTVIEASSSNVSSSNSGTCTSNLLAVPRAHQASYLSLQHGNSHTCLKTAVEQTTSESEGEINPCFSDSSNGLSDNMGSTNSLNDSYIIPSHGPKIKIKQPSVKCKVDQVDCPTRIESNISMDLPLRVGNPGKSGSDQSIRYKDLSDSSRALKVNRDRALGVSRDRAQEHSRHRALEVSRDREQCVINYTDLSKIEKNCHEDQILQEKNLRKLDMEGPSYSEKNSSINISGSSQYEKLQNSRHENPVYKSLNKSALILPGRPRVCSPLTQLRSDVKVFDKSQPVCSRSSEQLSGSCSRYFDHTYESINSILACEIKRRDSVASVEQNGSLNDTNGAHNLKETSGSNSEQQNDLSGTFPNHTYESIKSKVKSELEKSEIACENSAVIIGRRVSNPFDSNKCSKRMMNKKKQKSLKNNVNQSEKKVQKDSEERYSPFPGTKKLAFKSAFKQVSSPRFSVIQTVTGNMNSQVVYKPEMCPDSLNIKTPEIKVENCAQFFNNTAFISPKVLNANTFVPENASQKDTTDFLSPVPTYLSLKDCLSSKVGDTNLQTSLTEKRLCYRKSLPSLSDHLEEDILKHCNTNLYSKSTPCELDQPCQFF